MSQLVFQQRFARVRNPTLAHDEHLTLFESTIAIKASKRVNYTTLKSLQYRFYWILSGYEPRYAFYRWAKTFSDHFRAFSSESKFQTAKKPIKHEEHVLKEDKPGSQTSNQNLKNL